MAQKVVFITTTGTGTFTIPSDFGSLVSVEAIGAGGANTNPASLGGAGGGAYAKSVTVTGLNPGKTTYYSVPAGTTSGTGGDAWFNAASNAAPTLSSQGVLAKGGIAATTSTGGLGGQSASCVGDISYSGGSGGAYNSGVGGSGGAAGPGGIGGNGSLAAGGGAGRGAGGGGASLNAPGNNATNASGATGGNGGNGGGGTGGGAGTTTTGVSGTAGTGGGGGGGGSTAGAGGTGSIWTQTSDSATAGPGGGMGGGSAATSGGGGNYGGGGGYALASVVSGQGIIVFTYNAVKTVFITTTGTGTYTVPSDFLSLVSVEAIGGGGSGFATANTAGGGGGGAYARSTAVTGLAAGSTAYYQVGTTATDTWFNTASNAAPTFLGQGVLAKGGITATTFAGAAGGLASASIGTTTFDGGTGGTSTGNQSDGGGGGAGGPGGAGGTGGAGNGTATTSGGGGGSGATLTAAGTVGQAGQAAAGGAGGASAGQTGGSGGTSTLSANNTTPLNGGGGGGGGSGGGGGRNAGGVGAAGTYWTATAGGTAGSGGGGGGALAASLIPGGNGGLYGAGGGGSATGSLGGIGAQGIIVFTYNYKATTQFQSREGDLETLFVTDYAMIDQYASTGSLWTWGQNTNGQLGDNSIVHRSSPIQTVSGGTNWKLVAGGSYHTAAIKTDGTLWTWGTNTYGNLGDNTVAGKSSPVQTVSAGTNWKSVAGGTYHTAGIKTDGTLWLWGYNNNGQLGDNSITHRSSPIQTVSGGTNWKSVAGGTYHTAGIKTDGTLWLWGRNNYGQLGDNTVASKSSPVQTVSGGTNWKSVAGGYAHTAGIKTDGTLWLWGRNAYGQLGDNSITHRSSPIQTVSGGTNWKSVADGFSHTAAIKTDGTLWTWGYNTNGNLGVNTVVAKSSPVQTVSGGTNWKLVASGAYHIAAIFFYEADKLYPPS